MAAELRDSISIPMVDLSQVGEARRAAAALARRLGFSDEKSGEVSIVVSEAATNAVRHGKAGEIVLRPVEADAVLGVEMLAIDRGSGIASTAFALRDGFSTGGTQGTGLGAIRRLSSEFDLFSNTDSAAGGTGTVIFSRVWNAPKTPLPDGGLEIGAVCLPKPGEEACGDHSGVMSDGGRLTIVLADGLGHGVQAAEASRKAILTCLDHLTYDPLRLMETMHAALRSTRGAAVAVVELKPSAIQFVGVGNIAGTLIAPDTNARSMMSHNGTVGVEARRIQSIPYPWSEKSTLVLHSDGLATQWQLGKYPGLASRHPAVIAGVLYRDHRRLRDDVTVLVARQSATRGNSV